MEKQRVWIGIERMCSRQTALPGLMWDADSAHHPFRDLGFLMCQGSGEMISECLGPNLLDRYQTSFTLHHAAGRLVEE